MNRLKELRIKKNLTRKEVAEKLEIKPRTYLSYENNEREPNSEMLIALASFFDVSIDYLIGRTDNPQRIDLKKYGLKPIQTRKFRMLGKIACGEPIYCDEDFETYIEASSDIDADFCLTAKGDSMINARIFDGDVVFIKSASMVDNGGIAAVIIDDTAMLKRVYYYKDENKLVLMSENPQYTPFVYVNEELNKVRILGKAVCFMSNVK